MNVKIYLQGLNMVGIVEQDTLISFINSLEGKEWIMFNNCALSTNKILAIEENKQQ